MGRRAPLILLAVVFLPLAFIGAVYAMNSKAVRIERVWVYGAALLSPSEVESEVRNQIAGKKWFFLPNDNFFAVSAAVLGQSLLKKFTQASEVEVRKVFPRDVVVNVKERMLWGVYCARDRGEIRSCFYVDDRGTAYEDISSLEGYLLPILYSSENVALGSKATDEETIAFFGAAKKAASEFGADLLSLTFSTSTPGDARLGFAEGWSAIVTLPRPVEEWSLILKTLLEKDIGARRAELEYVDLRFGNKVFYKFK